MLGFVFKWIFRGLVVWITVVAVQSCGNLQVFSDDVPTAPLPGARPAGGMT